MRKLAQYWKRAVLLVVAVLLGAFLVSFVGLAGISSASRAFVQFIEHNEHFFVELGTIVIAAFTIVLGVATFLLWRATSDLVKGADANAERQLRAYVVIDVCQAVAATSEGDIGEEKKRLQAGSHAIAIVSYKNTGQTPAYDVRIDGEAELRPWPLTERDLTSRPTNPSSQAVLGRDGIFEVNVRELGWGPLVTARIEDLQKGRYAFVVWGRITYRDIFGKQWRTDFRYFIGGPRGLTGIRMAAHDGGNDGT